jgi:uncharacterized protein YcfJ
MQKINLFLLSLILVIGSGNAIAQNSEDDLDVLLGAVAGATLGSTIGDGDGKKIATVLGGLIGANVARDRHRGYYGSRRLESICKDRVPAQYRRNVGVTRSWINGCVIRLEQYQAELEQNAFEEALNGPSN